MRQALDHTPVVLATAVAADNGAPAALDGIAIADFKDAMPVSKYLMKVKMVIAAPGSFNLYLWGSDGIDWGEIGEAAGQLNEGALISGTGTVVRYLVLENLGLMQRIYVEVRDLTGTAPSIDLTLFKTIHQGN